MTAAAASPRPSAIADWAAHPSVRAGVGLALFAVFWELVARTALAGTFILAAPSEILLYIIEHWGLLSRALGVTLGEAALGFLFGNLAAIALAAVVALAPRLDGLVHGLALVVVCLPLVATGPILRVLYGPGIGPQVTLAALAVYYTTFTPLVVGLRATPASWLDLVASYGRGRLTALWMVRARASVPYLVAGLQIAAPAAFLGAMIGEFTGAERGMGVLSIQTMRSLDAPGTWALATIASAVAIAAYLAVAWVGRLLTTDRADLLLAAPAASRVEGWRGAALTALSAAATVLVILAVWRVSMDAFGLNRFFAKRPEDVYAFLATHANAAEHRATLGSALLETAGTAFPGYIAGVALGALLACVFALRPALASVALPVAIALRSIPIVATAPLIVLALGRDAVGAITIVAVMTFFPTLVACIQGLRQAPGQVLDVFDSYAAAPLRTLVYARVPAMLPALFASARMAAPAAVLAVTVAEWLATGQGVGNLMALTASTSSYNMLWSCVAVLTLLTVLVYALAGAVERVVLARFAPEQLRR